MTLTELKWIKKNDILQNFIRHIFIKMVDVFTDSCKSYSKLLQESVNTVLFFIALKPF